MSGPPPPAKKFRGMPKATNTLDDDASLSVTSLSSVVSGSAQNNVNQSYFTTRPKRESLDDTFTFALLNPCDSMDLLKLIIPTEEAHKKNTKSCFKLIYMAQFQHEESRKNIKDVETHLMTKQAVLEDLIKAAETAKNKADKARTEVKELTATVPA